MTPAELADEIEEALWKVGEASGEATYTQALADVGRIAAKNSRTLLAALCPPPQPEERIVAWLGEKDAAHQGIAAEMRAAGHPALAAEHTAFAQACRAIGDEIARGKHRATLAASDMPATPTTGD